MAHTRRSRGSLACLVVVFCASPARAQDDGAPATERGVRVHEQGAFDGYTLFTPLLSGNTYLVDMDGTVVHTWESKLPSTGAVYLKDDGHLLRCVRIEDNPTFHGGGIGGRIQELDWNGNVLWDFTLSDERRMQHHDIEPLPNGNLLLVVWEHMRSDDAVGIGRDPNAIGAEGLWPDGVLEVRPIRPDGCEIVWEWHTWDHLIQDTSDAKPFHGDVAEDPGKVDLNADHRDRAPETAAEREERERMEEEMRALGYVGGDEPEPDDPARPGPSGTSPDWLHTNAIDYHPELDLILLSTPRLSEIWIIDHSTTTEEAAGPIGGRRGRGGDLLYRWGNPRMYGAGSESDRQLFAQHDAQWIRPGLPGAGHVLVFNNGNGREDGDYSSVDELELPFDPKRGFVRERGGAFGPTAPLWSYRAPVRADFYSFFISGCQRLPNGNTLICSGAQGRFFEVTAEHEIVWDFWNPISGDIPATFGRAGGAASADWMDRHAVFRATRIPKDHPGLALE